MTPNPEILYLKPPCICKSYIVIETYDKDPRDKKKNIYYYYRKDEKRIVKREKHEEFNQSIKLYNSYKFRKCKTKRLI